MPSFTLTCTDDDATVTTKEFDATILTEVVEKTQDFLHGVGYVFDEIQVINKRKSFKEFQNCNFNDEELFDVITEMTFPEIREFFVRYVESAEPLPMDELLADFGIEYTRELSENRLSFGDIQFGLSSNQNIQVVNIEQPSPFTKKLKLEGGDELIALNGIPLELSNYQSAFDSFMSTPEGKKISVTVLRNGKEKTLKAKAIYSFEEAFNEIKLKDQNNDMLKIWSTMR